MVEKNTRPPAGGAPSKWRLTRIKPVWIYLTMFVTTVACLYEANAQYEGNKIATSEQVYEVSRQVRVTSWADCDPYVFSWRHITSPIPGNPANFIDDRTRAGEPIRIYELDHLRDQTATCRAQEASRRGKRDGQQ